MGTLIRAVSRADRKKGGLANFLHGAGCTREGGYTVGKAPGDRARSRATAPFRHLWIVPFEEPVATRNSTDNHSTMTLLIFLGTLPEGIDCCSI